MNLDVVKSACTLKMGKAALLARKFSPEILTVVGVTGVVAAGVMVARSSFKAIPVIEELKSEKALIKENPDRFEGSSKAQALLHVHAKAGLGLAKVYGPAITLGLASLTCLVSAHGLLRKRNAALAAAYKTVEESFNKYRERVTEELGEDQERDIFKGLKEEEITNEKGEKEIIKTPIDPNEISGYAVYFDELNVNWDKEPEYNKTWLLGVQAQLNDRLKAYGHVFLNELYTALDIPRTKAGQIVGWTKDGNGDGFIDLGIFNPNNMMAREFVNGHERSILIDPNVDGVILDAI